MRSRRGVEGAVEVGGDAEGDEQRASAGVVDVEFGGVLAEQCDVFGGAVRFDAERDAHLMLLVGCPCGATVCAVASLEAPFQRAVAVVRTDLLLLSVDR